MVRTHGASREEMFIVILYASVVTVEKIIEIELTTEEKASLHNSAETYRQGIGVIGY